MHGVVRLITSQIHPEPKLRRAIPALTCSSVSTARDLTLLTPLSVPSGNIVSTRSGTPKNMLISRKPGEPWSVQVWMKLNYDFEELESIFTKHLKRQLFNWKNEQASINLILIIHLQKRPRWYLTLWSIIIYDWF